MILLHLILFPCLPEVAPVAQSLPVAPVPEQFHITTVWDYVVHIRRLHVLLFLPPSARLCVPYLSGIYLLTTSGVSAAQRARSCVSYLNGIYPLTTSGAFAADCGGSCISYLHGTYPLTTSDVLPLIAADHVYHICMVHTLSQLPTFLPLLAANHV